MYDPANTYTDLVARVGETHLRQRLTIQVDHAGELLGRGRTLMHIENAEWLMVFIYYSLKVSGLFPWARRNCLDIQCVANDVFLPSLPRAFDGFTPLHLSDLHLDIDPELTGAIARRLQGVSYALCVVTGDFRASSSGGPNLETAYHPHLVGHPQHPV